MVKKNKGFKPTNKMRDEAISHILGKTKVLEQMIEGIAMSFDTLLQMEGKKQEYIDYCEKLRKEELNDQQGTEKNDGKSVGKDIKDAGQRTEGVCKED